MQFILAGAATAGLVRTMENGAWIDLTGVPSSEAAPSPTDDAVPVDDVRPQPDADPTAVSAEPPPSPGASRPRRGRKVFIAHGTNHTPLEQLTTAGVPQAAGL